MHKPNVWVVDDDRSIRWVLERAFLQAGMLPTTFESADLLLKRLAREVPDAVVSDIRMPGIDGLALLDRIHGKHPELPVIIMTAHADLERAVAAFQGGAFEYLPKPFDVDDAVAIVRRAVRRQGELLQRKQGATAEKYGATGQDADPGVESDGTQPRGSVGDLVGAAPAMQELYRAIGRLSRSNMTVLITGESGTGKELIARALHRHSPRAERPFIALNTAAIPRDLLESELFGHERGAFTGANAQRLGRFEQANTGTLFLDEIGDMPAELQTRLLRVLADGEFYRVGGHVPVRVDVRVVAATHQDLEKRVLAGDFREDLFHRLHVIRLHIPPLRERKEDIAALAAHFLSSASRELDVEVKQLTPAALELFQQLHWPGNVRELENVCRWLTVMSPGREIHPEDLPDRLREVSRPDVDAPGSDWEQVLARWVEQCLERGETAVLARAVPTFERIMLQIALRQTGGRRQEAARLLGWGRNTLTRKLKELAMDL
ncbi:MAG TPA: nitrogen regulation protein NR(I) [Gammaproteobacteria bacterium]|nr:nitrogen regulation protein NR(I) [Gammaproteobacteria bacterium]